MYSEKHMDISQILNTVLSLVALSITIVGFFASLKYYRDGVQTQIHVDSVLGKIEERAGSIQAQVGGMFERTLTAAVSRAAPAEAGRQQSRLLLEEDKSVTKSSGTTSDMPEESTIYEGESQSSQVRCESKDPEALHGGRFRVVWHNTPRVVHDRNDESSMGRVRQDLSSQILNASECTLPAP